ncbi:MAG TPA: hypothetical protein VGC46_12220 [Allosphingosinicella sp.]
MILTFLLAAQLAAAADDDRIYRIGGESHVLRMQLQWDYFGDPANRARLVGDGFAPACAAHFLALRRVEPRYAEGFRPIVIASVRAVVPPERLAEAQDGSMFLGSGLAAWQSPVRAEIERRAEILFERARTDHQRLAEEELAARRDAWPGRVRTGDRTRMNVAQLATACAIYFGDNREAILATSNAGESR